MAPAVSPPSRCVVAGTWVDPATGRLLARTAVLARAARARIVLLGERHDAADHHRWQLDVIAGLAALRETLVVGFEAFSRGDQSALDAWVAGDLPLDALLTYGGWKERWGIAADLYVPLLHFTRRHRIPTLALNVDHAVVVRIRERGWPHVSLADRQGIGDPAPPTPAYAKRLLDEYAEHGCRTPAAVRDTPGFARFVDVQLLWDRGMAEALANAAVRSEDALLVGLVGSGHLEYGGGIPRQLAALGWTDVVVLLPWDVTTPCGTLRPGLANAVFGVASLAADVPAPARHRCESAMIPQPPPR